MRIPFLAFLITFLLNPQTPLSPPPVVVRDPQAVAVLQKSIALLGVLPSDSSATGNIMIVAGSLTQQGTIKILTRGTSQTSVTVQAESTNWSVIYSSSQANRIEGDTITVLPLELVASSQSVYFPLPYLSGLLNNPDESLQFVAQEILGSGQANHIRVQNTFSSVSQLGYLADFTVTDIWLDAVSGLPAQVSFIQRDGGGSSPKIAIAVSYANFQPVSGVQYPFSIQESVNGTPWATISIQSVALNSGLTNANFPVQ